MDSLEIKGKIYKKTAVLAEKYAYTSDYLGQLCREEKVEAEMVGRSWYISEESLQAHQDGRYQKEEEESNSEKKVVIKKQDKKTNDRPALDTQKLKPKTTSRRRRDVVVQKQTIHAVPESRIKDVPLRTPSTFSYDTDDAPLIPLLNFDSTQSGREAHTTPFNNDEKVSVPIHKPDTATDAEEKSELFYTGGAGLEEGHYPKVDTEQESATKETDEPEEVWSIPIITEEPFARQSDVTPAVEKPHITRSKEPKVQNNPETQEDLPLSPSTEQQPRHLEAKVEKNKKEQPKTTNKKIGRVRTHLGHIAIFLCLLGIFVFLTNLTRVYTIAAETPTDVNFHFEMPSIEFLST